MTLLSTSYKNTNHVLPRRNVNHGQPWVTYALTCINHGEDHAWPNHGQPWLLYWQNFPQTKVNHRFVKWHRNQPWLTKLLQTMVNDITNYEEQDS